jgi:hypothetical protein
LRLLIAQPTYGQVAATCARSMAMLCHRIGHAPPDGLDWLGFEQQSSSNLPELRHKLAANALTVHRATHILWIDSDMGFPADAFHRLLAHGKEIVGCTYPRRLGGAFSSATDLDGQPFKASSTGLEQAGVIGFGLLLTRACVFDGDYEMPLFAHHDERGYMTEDVSFSQKARARGHEIWVDHDLSREVVHIGSVTLTHAHREAAE